MIAHDVGVDAERPLGILERLQIPVVSELLAELKNADPQIAAVVMDLYDFSYVALRDLSDQILGVREEVAGGKAFKALSLPSASGGFTYAVAREFNAESRRAAQAVGAMHKYETKSDRWYVILDSIETSNPIDGILLLVWPWKEDEREAQNSQQVSKYFKSRRETVTTENSEKDRPKD